MSKIGLVGAGRMARALTIGITKSGFTAANKVIASAHIDDQDHLKIFADMGCQTTNSNLEVAQKSDVIVLAVKPSVVQEVLRDIAPAVDSKHLVISMALGISLKKIETVLPPRSRAIRVMPNTPCVVMQGATVLCRGTNATLDDAAFARRLFSCVGICEDVPEGYVDAVTALSGSGPAYIYAVIEALSDGGVKMGLTRDLSTKLAAQTVLGAAKMVLDEKRHPSSLKDDVTSPGGSTIHGLHVLEKGGLRGLFISAVEEASRRAKELAAQFN